MQRIGKTPANLIACFILLNYGIVATGFGAWNDAFGGADSVRWKIAGPQPEPSGTVCRMSDDPKAAAAAIIDTCEDMTDVETQVIHHAWIFAFLVCHAVREKNEDEGAMEAAIRDFYRAWADIAVDELRLCESQGSVAH